LPRGVGVSRARPPVLARLRRVEHDQVPPVPAEELERAVAQDPGMGRELGDERVVGLLEWRRVDPGPLLPEQAAEPRHGGPPDALFPPPGVDAKMAAMLTLASYLAENARPVHERIAAWVGRRVGEPAALLAAPWEERLRWLDDGRVHVGFLCGWPYSQRVDR